MPPPGKRRLVPNDSDDEEVVAKKYILSPTAYRTLAPGLWQKIGTEEYYRLDRKGNPVPARHSGRIELPPYDESQQQQKKTSARRFNLRCRARPSKPDTKFIFDKSDPSMAELAAKLGVPAFPMPRKKFLKRKPSFGKTFTWENEHGKLSERPPSPRPSLQSKKNLTRPPLSPVANDEKTQTLRITKQQIQSPRRNAKSVMKGSAQEHGESKLPGLSKSRLEHLHLTAHSLGGKETVENLVVGTYDANTRMIPFEQMLAEKQKLLKKGEFIDYEVHAPLFPGTHIARTIEMKATFPVRFQSKPAIFTIDALDNTKVTTAQYDLAKHTFK